MLVLSRKLNESIVIADVVQVVILAIQGDRIRLGIEAPKEVSVHRKEVWDAIQQETLRNQQSESNSTVPSVYAHQAHIDARRQNREDFEAGNHGDVSNPT